MKKYILIFIVLISCASSNAQRHLYHRIDVGSSNIYTFVLSNLLTGYTNYFTHDMLFDNSYVYTLYSGKIEGETTSTKPYNPMGLTATDLFNDSFAGVKLGYQSDLQGSFNWGIYASGHYKINQIKAKTSIMDDFSRECFQFIKSGIGILFTFGNIESPVKVQIEATARYDYPIAYKGCYGNSTGSLEKGLSSHFAVKVAGYSWLSTGLYADIYHHNLFKNMSSNCDFKPYSFGVTFTITPKRGEDLYD